MKCDFKIGMGLFVIVAIVSLSGALSASAESQSIHISLSDRYEMDNHVDGDFRVLNRFNECALYISMSKEKREDLYYCELPKAFLFRILPADTTPATSGPKSERYYFLEKGKRVKDGEPLSVESFDAALKERGVGRASVNWVLARPAERLRSQWLIDEARTIAFVVGIFLPIPFVFVFNRYRSLRKHLRMLQSQPREAAL